MELLHHSMITSGTPLSQEECRYYMTVLQVVIINNVDFDKYLESLEGFDLQWYIENPEFSVIEVL